MTQQCSDCSVMAILKEVQFEYSKGQGGLSEVLAAAIRHAEEGGAPRTPKHQPTMCTITCASPGCLTLIRYPEGQRPKIPHCGKHWRG